MFYKFIEGDYLIAIGTGIGGIEITENEYNSLQEIIFATKEEPPIGKKWMLRADTLVYELVDAPVIEDADISDYEKSLERLGVEI